MAALLAAYIYAFAAGFLFGLSDVLVRVAVQRLRAEQVLLTSLAVGSPLLWAVGAAIGEPVPRGEAAMLYIAAGFMNFVVGRLLFYIAVAGLGAGSASVATSPAVVLSGLLAWVFLDEEPTLRDAIGLALVTLAVYMASRKPSGRPVQGVGRRAGLAAGLAASLAFASSAVLVRAAGSTAGSPVMGAALSYTVALPFSLLLAARAAGGVPIQPGFIAAREGQAALAAAVVVAFAQASRYKALSLAPVVEAIVLISLFPLHTVALARLLLRREEERVEAAHAVAALLASAGVASAVTG